MATLSESVTRTRQYPAWSGSIADFRRLLRLVERPFDALVEQYVLDEQVPWERRIADQQQRIGVNARRLQESEDESSKVIWQSREVELQDDLAALETRKSEAAQNAMRAGELEMELKSGREDVREVSGTADELCDWLDGRRINSLKINAPSGGIANRRIALYCDDDDGLRILVSGRDSQWATAAFAELTEEAALRIPGWRWLRSFWVLWPLYGVAIAILTYSLGNIIAALTTPTGKFDNTIGSVAWLIVFACTALIPILLARYTRRRLVAFEIVPVGSRSRGRAVIGVIGSSIGAIVLGVAGNMVTTLVT